MLHVFRSLKPTFKCQFCDMLFFKKTRLAMHLSTHDGLQPFTCPFLDCHKRFSRKDRLKAHLKVHGGYSSSISRHFLDQIEATRESSDTPPTTSTHETTSLSSSNCEYE